MDVLETKTVKKSLNNVLLEMIGSRLVNSIVLFLILFSLVHIMKPALIYNHAGGFRPFGLGYKQKTVVPMWLAAIMLAITCYLVMFAVDKYVV